jgi:hypothetical protein
MAPSRYWLADAEGVLSAKSPAVDEGMAPNLTDHTA